MWIASKQYSPRTKTTAFVLRLATTLQHLAETLPFFQRSPISFFIGARIGPANISVFNGSIFFGATHQDVAQVLDLSIPSNGETLRLSLDRSTHAEIISLAGARSEFTPAVKAQLEFGLGERQSQMLNRNYRM